MINSGKDISPQTYLSPEEKSAIAKSEFFATAKRLAEFFHSNNVEYRFVGGYATNLLARIAGIPPLAKSPKDIDVIVFDRSSIIKVFQAGYQLREESPSASDIKAEPEIMNPSSMIFTATDRKTQWYVGIDIFLVSPDNEQATMPPFVSEIDGIPYKFLPLSLHLGRLKTYYENHKGDPRYQNKDNGRMEDDLQKIVHLEEIIKNLKT